jgi:beta-N-acetylhexosaminidase
MTSPTRRLAIGALLMLALGAAALPEALADDPQQPRAAAVSRPQQATAAQAAAARAARGRATPTRAARAQEALEQEALERAALAQLTPEQLAGQRVVYSYPGATPPAALLRDIRAGRVGGVIFFSDNISGPSRFGTVVAELRHAQQQSGVGLPLLLMTDQEGGLVRRLPGDPVPSERRIGQEENPAAAAAQAGSDAGRNLLNAGLNVNLAPVLDVYGASDDFIDRAQRSYSQDPAVAAAAGRAFIAAQQRVGVAATAKHFPGLGSAPAGRNTDEVPVTLPVPLGTLRAVDGAPYPAAIAAGVKLVMVSWAVYPALDPDHPAGLSPIVVGRELRGRLGYQGVTITDALEAGALRGVGSTEQRALAAAGAGMDLLLCSGQDPAQGERATAALAEALTSGRLDRAGFTAAVNRTGGLRAGLR